MRIKNITVILLFIILSGCQYFTMMPYREWKEINDKDEVDIYVAGSYNALPCYWKNGIKTELEHEGTGYATSISFNGQNLYIGGGDNGFPCYWKNGKKINLDHTGNLGATLFSMSVNGGIVFSCGYETIISTQKACYWINEKQYFLKLPNGATGDSRGISIVVDNDTLNFYISGYYQNGTNYACYWENGGECITIGTSGSEAQDIFVSNGKKYILIEQLSNMSYWVDGASYLLQGAPTLLSSIYVYNGDVFVAGKIGTDVCIWKNQNLNNILSTNDAINALYANTISIYNDDIYVAGMFNNIGVNNASYWKNNNLTNLSFSGTTSLAFTIVVKPRR